MQEQRRFRLKGAVMGLLVAAGSGGPIAASEILIEDFSEGAVVLRWQIVNDSVMGGISNSDVGRVTDETVRFSGTLSLENNGGFASMRSAGRMPDLAGTDAVVVRVKGDGRTYQLRLRTGNGWRVPDYRAEFETRLGEWQTHVLPLREFKAGWRGMAVRDAPPIEAGQIRSVGILLGDKKPGGFMLEIDWIKATDLSRGMEI